MSQHRYPCTAEAPTITLRDPAWPEHIHACIHDATDEHFRVAEHKCECGTTWRAGGPKGLLTVPPPLELLTTDEHQALALSGELWNTLTGIVGDRSSRQADLRELAAHIHGVQNAILAHAAARAMPHRFRMLGEEAPR